ncbi:hypothetical protein H2199_007147 [Coniosporium tulheliwenetii]|uniref:Uncharacterized protein n=1 Tax=Coniosporium tulheliwenetii TaxID=3383036 RepID=A0ACC2YRH1_9PEZI|nr:hypothetical protein H2199_007147 [Cladosporium sp. JES 115]
MLGYHAADEQTRLQQRPGLRERDQDYLIRHLEIQTTSAREAEARLGFEEVVAAFPKTGKAVTDFSGPYTLPISGVTPPVVAIRPGLAFLGECCEKEKVEWEAQVKLE